MHLDIVCIVPAKSHCALTIPHDADFNSANEAIALNCFTGEWIKGFRCFSDWCLLSFIAVGLT